MRGYLALGFVLAMASCQPDLDRPSPPPPFAKRHETQISAISMPPVVLVPPAPLAQSSTRWTFAVMSDLHLPNYKTPTVTRTVAALVALHPRLVVITGDHTNGSGLGPRPGHKLDLWWQAVTGALQPLRDAGIPVLPVAGNHDSYLLGQREGYAAAFADLKAWAAPLEVEQPAGNILSVAHAPFSYSVDIDDVHLSLTHVVAQRLDKDVATWLAADLAAASGAKHRIVFGHVPMSSVIQPPSQTFVSRFGAILAAGHAEMYVAGHEHLVWDEDVELPGGALLRQILVGCTSGFYDFAPNDASRKRADCVPTVRAGRREPQLCKMPHGGGEFELSRGRKNRQIQHYKNSFTLFTVDGETITARPMTIDDAGNVLPFYLNE